MKVMTVESKVEVVETKVEKAEEKLELEDDKLMQFHLQGTFTISSPDQPGKPSLARRQRVLDPQGNYIRMENDYETSRRMLDAICGHRLAEADIKRVYPTGKTRLDKTAIFEGDISDISDIFDISDTDDSPQSINIELSNCWPLDETDFKLLTSI